MIMERTRTRTKRIPTRIRTISRTKTLKKKLTTTLGKLTEEVLITMFLFSTQDISTPADTTDPQYINTKLLAGYPVFFISGTRTDIRFHFPDIRYPAKSVSGTTLLLRDKAKTTLYMNF